MVSLHVMLPLMTLSATKLEDSITPDSFIHCFRFERTWENISIGETSSESEEEDEKRSATASPGTLVNGRQ